LLSRAPRGATSRPPRSVWASASPSSRSSPTTSAWPGSPRGTRPPSPASPNVRVSFAARGWKMRRDRYLKHLAAVPIFQALSQKELTLVGRLAEDLKVDAGEALVHEGRRE